MATNKDDQVITTQNTNTDNVFNNDNTMNGSVQPKASTTGTSSPSTTPPVTSDNDITDSSSGIDKNFQDKDDPTKYSSTPNTTTNPSKSNTGSGLTAAEGTEYSWNEKAEERAGLDYQSAVLESKSNYLANRQQIESQAQEAQNQFAMKQYSQNQSNEKAGWTGGYILDTDRQVEYLKATIQAQMYGQMELQKYGYDTSLAAARLAYDTNKYDLALEYYNTALSRAVSEAEITGYYVSPETSEMLDEYSIASKILNDETSTQEDKDRANSVLNAVYKWFEDNGISKQGVETYSHIVEERTYKMSLESALKYINEANKQIDSNTFTKVDADGNISVSDDGTTVETINFNTATTEEILQYITNNEKATQQYYGYLDTKITQQSQDQFYDWLISKNLLTAEKQESGTTSYVAKDGVDYKTELYSFLKESSVYQSIMEDFNDMSTEDASALRDIYENWDFQIDLPNGTSIKTTLNNLKSSTLNSISSSEVTSGDINKTDEEGNKVNNFPVTESSSIINGHEVTTQKFNNEITFFEISGENDINNLGYDVKMESQGFKVSVNGKTDPLFNQEFSLNQETLDYIKEAYKYSNENAVVTEGNATGMAMHFVYKGEVYTYLEAKEGDSEIGYLTTYSDPNCKGGNSDKMKQALKDKGIWSE